MGKEDLRTASWDLWNTFDPIGTGPMGIEDEYDRYLKTTMRLITEGADRYRMTAYVEQIVRVSMGLPGAPAEKIEGFVTRLLALK